MTDILIILGIIIINILITVTITRRLEKRVVMRFEKLLRIVETLN